jgi:hypothetical protein
MPLELLRVVPNWNVNTQRRVLDLDPYVSTAVEAVSVKLSLHRRRWTTDLQRKSFGGTAFEDIEITKGTSHFSSFQVKESWRECARNIDQ